MNVVFVDFGHPQLLVSAWAFNRRKSPKMVSIAWDDIGGKDIDAIFAKEIAKRSETENVCQVNVCQNARAYPRLINCRSL